MILFWTGLSVPICAHFTHAHPFDAAYRWGTFAFARDLGVGYGAADNEKHRHTQKENEFELIT